MSYRHPKGRRQKPLAVVTHEGGFWVPPSKKRAPIRLYPDGVIEDDFLLKYSKRLARPAKLPKDWVKYILHLMKHWEEYNDGNEKMAPTSCKN
jgi:hypothetical protein